MRQKFTQKSGFMLLLFLFAFVQGAWAEDVTPTLTVSYPSQYEETGFNFLIGSGTCPAPVVTLYNGTTNVRGYYKVTYSIDGTEGTNYTISDKTDNDGNKIQIDSKTGSELNTARGIVDIGGKPGKVTIKVIATPTRLGERKGFKAPDSKSYDINITSPSEYTVTAYKEGKALTNKDILSLVTKGANSWSIFSTKQTIDSVKVTYKLNGLPVDVTNYFDITYNTPENIKITKDDKKYTIESTEYTTSEAGSTNSKALTFTAKIKDDAKGIYGENAQGQVSLTIKTRLLGTNDKIKTYIQFANNEQTIYKQKWEAPYTGGDNDYTTWEYKIVDKDGNDYTSEYDRWGGITASGVPQNAFAKFSKDPLDYGRNMKAWNGTDSIPVTLFGGAPDYIHKIMQDGSDKPNGIIIYQYKDQSTGAYRFTGQAAFPDDYILTAKATINDWSTLKGIISDEAGASTDDDNKDITIDIPGQFYSTNQENVYHVTSNQIVVHSLKRSPELSLSPDPSTRPIARNYVMTMSSRFSVIGSFNDSISDLSTGETAKLYLGNDENGEYHNDFWYMFFVPDDNAFGKVDGSGKWIGEADSIAAEKKLYKDEACTQPNGKVAVQVYSPALAANGKIVPGISLAIPAYYRNDDGSLYLDKNGNPIPEMLTINGKSIQKDTVVTGTLYMSEKEYGNENDDKWKIIFHGEGFVPLFYITTPWNYTRWDIGKVSTQFYNIKEKENLRFVLTPKSYTISIGQTSPVPSARIVDDYNQDFSKYFNFDDWKKITDTGNSITILNADHTSYGKAVGSAEMTVTPTLLTTDKLKAAEEQYGEFNYDKYGSTFSPTSDTYRVNVIGDPNETAQYDIIYDGDYYKNAKDSLDGNNLSIPNIKTRETSRMGKLHFIKGGEFFSGTVSDGEAPGVKITFGNGEGNGGSAEIWQVNDETDITDDADDKFDESHHYILTSSDKALFGDGVQPIAGGYIKLEPTTNGFLTIDVGFGTSDKPQKYVLYDSQKSDYQKQIVSRPTVDDNGNEISASTDWYGEQSFAHPLLAGHTYYLYNGSEQPLNLHGLLFKPAYVVMLDDTEPADEATTFLNTTYRGDLPTVISKEQENVSFTTTYATPNYGKGQWPISKSVDVNGTPTNINIKQVLTVHPNGDIDAMRATASTGRARIRAAVKGKTHYAENGETVNDEVYRTPYIDLAIVGIPMYKPFLGEGINPGKRVTTTNYVTRIWMTYGGFDHNDQSNYPYIHNNKELTDRWNNVKSDTVGADNRTIDGFKFQSTGGENPVSEDDIAWDKSNHTTFDLPTRGSYLKFEPEEDGTLMVHVLQNGMTDLCDAKPTNKVSAKDKPQELRRRALYIVDEHGKTVDIEDNNDDWNSSLSNYLSSQQNPQSKHLNYVAEALLRCSWNFLKHYGDHTYSAFNFSQWKSSYPASETKDWNDDNMTGTKGLDQNSNIYKDINPIIEWWSNGVTGDELGGTNFNKTIEVFKLSDGSFVTPTKAYVRYTFKVKAGKTYYVYMLGSKLGCAGFAFIPEGFRTNAENWQACTKVEEGEDYNMNVQEEGLDDDKRQALPEPSASSKVYSGSLDEQNISEASKENKISEQALDKFKKSFVNVKLERNFTPNEWTSICLPFSVSEYKVKKIFGDDASVIVFDSVMTAHKDTVRSTNDGNKIDTMAIDVQARTAHFTRHINQLIEAGRPYFIKPTFKVDGKNSPYATFDGDKVTAVEFTHVSFDADTAMTDTCYNISARQNVADATDSLALDKYKDNEYYKNLKESKTIFTYRFTGIFDKSQIPWYSYVMGTNTNSSKGETGNGLYRIVPSNGNKDSEKPWLKGFRAYLYPTKDYDGSSLEPTNNTTPAKFNIADYWITGAEVYGDAGSGTATGIDELVAEMNTMLTAGRKGVYNLQGQMIRMNNDLNGLPSGVYIMNGKKYLIK